MIRWKNCSVRLQVRMALTPNSLARRRPGLTPLLTCVSTCYYGGSQTVWLGRLLTRGNAKTASLRLITAVIIRQAVKVHYRFTRFRTDSSASPSSSGPLRRSTIRSTSPAQLTCSASAFLASRESVACAV